MAKESLLLLGLGSPCPGQLSLRYAADTGFLGIKTFSALKLVSFLWKGDVRENERINKALKLFWQRTPNGSKELSSARATLRHQLGPSQNECMKGKAVKWSTVRPAVQSLSSRLLDSWHEVNEVLSQPDRWAPANVPDDHPDGEMLNKLLPKLNPLSPGP